MPISTDGSTNSGAAQSTSDQHADLPRVRSGHSRNTHCRSPNRSSSGRCARNRSHEFHSQPRRVHRFRSRRVHKFRNRTNNRRRCNPYRRSSPGKPLRSYPWYHSSRWCRPPLHIQCRSPIHNGHSPDGRKPTSCRGARANHDAPNTRGKTDARYAAPRPPWHAPCEPPHERPGGASLPSETRKA